MDIKFFISKIPLGCVECRLSTVQLGLDSVDSLCRSTKSRKTSSSSVNDTFCVSPILGSSDPVCSLDVVAIAKAPTPIFVHGRRYTGSRSTDHGHIEQLTILDDHT